MKPELLDTRYQVETPEGIDLHATLAGPMVRILAYLIDFMWRSLVLAILSFLLFFAGKMGIGLFFLLSFLLEWFYPVLFEVYAKGQTPGKKAMGIAVVNDDLTPIYWSPSLTRNLLRAADFFPFFYLGGIFCLVASRHFQRLGDLAAGSLVIYREQIKPRLSLPDCLPYPPPILLSSEEQIAVIHFAERHTQLSLPRQQELAEIVITPLKASRDQAVSDLHGMGCWLLGKHDEAARF